MEHEWRISLFIFISVLLFRFVKNNLWCENNMSSTLSVASVNRLYLSEQVWDACEMDKHALGMYVQPEFQYISTLLLEFGKVI
jgi:hypothetical protein